jgi:DNA adenine methylase
LSTRSLLYLDPPYYVKGQEMLYASYYEHNDHVEIAEIVRGLSQRWVVSYDDAPQIRELYNGFRSVGYGISYSASDRYVGREVTFFSSGLTLPTVSDPTRITPKDLVKWEAFAAL